jgi:hypothetical protein
VPKVNAWECLACSLAFGQEVYTNSGRQVKISSFLATVNPVL